jgi:hypothetical protein
MLARVSGRPNRLQSKVTAEMTLYTNRLLPRLAGQMAPKRELPPELAKLYTQVGDVTGKLFQDFLDKAKLRREAKETDLAFARRVFLYISLHFKYGPNKEGVDTVQTLTGDCGGLASVFDRSMRANGVPARLILGRWAASENPPTDSGYHVKAEFFADKLGWVGIDMSGGVGQQDDGNPLICFGNEWGDFVVFDLSFPLRQVVLFPGDAPAGIWGSQGTWVFPRPDPGKVKWSSLWTVETLVQHPATTPYRPGWKRPPPSGPTFLPVNLPTGPTRQASIQPKPIAPTQQASIQPKQVSSSRLPETSLPKADTGSKATDAEPMVLWMSLSAVVAGVLVVGLGMLFLKRGRAPQAVAVAASVKVRCPRCGQKVKVLSGEAGKKFQCPGCGVILTMGVS